MIRCGVAALICLLIGISLGWITSALLWGTYALKAGLGALGCIVFVIVAVVLAHSFALKHGWIKPPAEQWVQGVQSVRQYPHWEPPKSKASNRERQ